MGNFIFWAIALITAGMTAFYIFRVYFSTFIGEKRSPDAHPHESPTTMVLPLIILAVFALGGGLLSPLVDGFLAPVFGREAHHFHDGLLETIAVIAGIGGIVTAALVYQISKDRIELMKEAFAPLYDLVFHKYYIDEIYDFLIVNPTKAIGAFMEEKAEKQGIDFAVDEVGFQVKEVSRRISFWQSGRIRSYALNMVAGMVIILLFVVFL